MPPREYSQGHDSGWKANLKVSGATNIAVNSNVTRWARPAGGTRIRDCPS